MSWIGDFRLGDTLDCKFCTVQATGAPTTLAGSPVISAYPGNSTTQLTAGITLSVDFDSVTGLNNVRVVASGGNGYLTATNYTLVITTGTVNSVSAVGYVVGEFSIENRSALMPTTATRTADIAATGEIGLDFDNVKTATGATTLTNIRIPNVTLADTVTTYTGNTPQTGDNFARIGAAGAGLTALGDARIANLDATVSSRTKPADTQAAVTTTTNLTNAPTAGDFTATMKTSIGTAVAASAVASVAAPVAITSNVKKNQALAKFQFLMTDSTTHAPVTGKVVTVTRSIDGGPYAAGTLSAVTEVGSGLYYVDFASGDLNGNVIVLRATAATSDDTVERIVTQP